MKIKGTERDVFGLRTDFFYLAGEIISADACDGTLIEVKELVRDDVDSFLYLVLYPALIDDELDNAIEHFRFLRKYNLA